MCVALVGAQEPRHVGGALVGRRREHRRAESLHETPRVALVPRAGQHDHRLAGGSEFLDLARHGQRVEEN